MTTETIRDVIISDDREGSTVLRDDDTYRVLLPDGTEAELRLRVARGRLIRAEGPRRVR